MTTCLILAAGNAERHNGGNKPLLKVNGETLLDRTVSAIRDRAGTIFLVTHKEIPVSQHGLTARFLPSRRRWIVETLLCTAPLWSNVDSTIVLLGDVYYTEHAVSELFNDGIKCAAFGKGCNIHALRWHSMHNEKISVELSKSVKSAETHPQSYGAGKLWRFVTCCHPEIPVIDFGDETTDFDSPQEHKRFIEKYASRH